MMNPLRRRVGAMCREGEYEFLCVSTEEQAAEDHETVLVGVRDPKAKMEFRVRPPTDLINPEELAEILDQGDDRTGTTGSDIFAVGWSMMQNFE